MSDERKPPHAALPGDEPTVVQQPVPSRSDDAEPGTAGDVAAGTPPGQGGARPAEAPGDDQPTRPIRFADVGHPGSSGGVLPGAEPGEETTRLTGPTEADADPGGATTRLPRPEAPDEPSTRFPGTAEPAGEAARFEGSVGPGEETVDGLAEPAAEGDWFAAPGEAGPGEVGPGEAGPGEAGPGEAGPREAGPDAGAVGEETTRLAGVGAGGADGERAGGPTRRPGEEGDPVSPDPVTPGAAVSGGDGAPLVPDGAVTTGKPAGRRRLSSAGALIWVLLALFGFTLVVQLRSNDGDQGLATARQEDLVRILSDLEARDSRLQSEISALETSQRQLTSGVAGRQAALEEAEKRADELGLLAGTLPGRGPGLVITLDKVKASAVLNAVQELRGAGGEVMQIAGPGGAGVRIVASSYFVDAEGGGIVVDGARLVGPWTLSVIGVPQTMQTALQIPGGVVASVNSAGGSVTMEQRSTVEVTAVRKATTLQYARPVS